MNLLLNILARKNFLCSADISQKIPKNGLRSPEPKMFLFILHKRRGRFCAFCRKREDFLFCLRFFEACVTIVHRKWMGRE
jgi:hypothetical protein